MSFVHLELYIITTFPSICPSTWRKYVVLEKELTYLSHDLLENSSFSSILLFVAVCGLSVHDWRFHDHVSVMSTTFYFWRDRGGNTALLESGYDLGIGLISEVADENKRRDHESIE